MSADASTGDGDPADHPLVGDRHDSVELPVIPPAVEREAVESSGRVGAVASPSGCTRPNSRSSGR